LDRVRSVNEGAFARRFTAKVSKGAKKGEGRRGNEGEGGDRKNGIRAVDFPCFLRYLFFPSRPSL